MAGEPGLGEGLGGHVSRFVVGRDGRIEPGDEEARRALDGRTGEFVLLPTAPDLVWLTRAVPQGGPAPSPRVVMAGDASGFPLSDLIAFLSQSRWTGAVRVQAAGGQRAIMLKDGEIRGATSDSEADKLGEVMVRLGYVNREVLARTLEEHPPSRLGRALVEKGVLQAHDVWKCITYQVSEIFHAMMLSRDGVFMLVDQELDEKNPMNVQLSLQSLLMDSIRKVDEMAHFRKRIPHGRLYVHLRQPTDGRLEPEEDVLLALVNGQRTVVELGAHARLGEFDATRIVYRLLEGGYAQVSDRPAGGGEAPRTATPAPVPAAGSAGSAPRVVSPAPVGKTPEQVVQIFNQIFTQIRAEVEKQDMARELIAAANAALGGKALSQSPVLEGVLFDREGNLPQAALLSRFEETKGRLGAEPVASLRQALSDVMFFLLFQAGELLESRQDEALAQRVKELLAPLDEL